MLQPHLNRWSSTHPNLCNAGVVQATNDLDVSTVEAVEGMLEKFQGVLCVVSHDRAFLESTADRLLVLEGDGLVRVFDGPYSEVCRLC